MGVSESVWKVTSILVTEVWEEICWWQPYDFGDGNNLVTIIFLHYRRVPTFKRCHQQSNVVTNFKSPTSRCHQHHCPQFGTATVILVIWYHWYPDVWVNLGTQKSTVCEPKNGRNWNCTIWGQWRKNANSIINTKLSFNLEGRKLFHLQGYCGFFIPCDADYPCRSGTMWF